MLLRSKEKIEPAADCHSAAAAVHSSNHHPNTQDLFCPVPRRKECRFWTLLDQDNKLSRPRAVQNQTFHSLLHCAKHFISALCSSSSSSFSCSCSCSSSCCFLCLGSIFSAATCPACLLACLAVLLLCQANGNSRTMKSGGTKDRLKYTGILKTSYSTYSTFMQPVSLLILWQKHPKHSWSKASYLKSWITLHNCNTYHCIFCDHKIVTKTDMKHHSQDHEILFLIVKLVTRIFNQIRILNVMLEIMKTFNTIVNIAKDVLT